MASSDFDDIFGDLKEDQHFSPSLASSDTDLDDASIFGDDGPSSAVMNMKPTTAIVKPTTVSSSSSNGPPPAAADQDEFLSWLDDEPSSSSGTVPTAPPTVAAGTTQQPPRPPAMDTIDLGGDDEDDDFLANLAPTRPTSSSYDEEPLDSPASAMAAVNPMPPAVPLNVNMNVNVNTNVNMTTTISLDDDDDDDLEKIIEQTKAANNARKSGSGVSSSRENSNSSLQIKSQSQRHDSGRGSAKFDVDALTRQFNSSGVVATPAARVAMWHHALCHGNASGSGGSAPAAKESISMYAVQTTPLDLPNQQVLRKDVEDMCSSVFASAIHTESLRYSSSDSAATGSASSNDDGTRLVFIDNAEILVTFLCKKLHLSEYPAGFAFAFGPAIAVSGNDPLCMDLIATLQAACQHVMPHLAKQIAPQHVADARRGLLKWLLLYHAPAVAFHLDQHFHTWNTDPHTIPDAWLASMFESDPTSSQSRGSSSSSKASSFDGLVQIWDCCALLRDLSSHVKATRAFPSTTTCFVAIHLILQAEKKLLRMEGDQLTHCMRQTLVDTLHDKTPREPLVLSVRRLIEATPPSVCIKLRDAGLTDSPSASEESSSTSSSSIVDEKSAKPFSLLTASTNGVKQVGSLVMIDMPTKLLTTMAMPIKFTLAAASSAASSSLSASGGAGAKDHSANEAFFTQLMREATPASSVCVTLAAADVIPQVFASFQAQPTPPVQTDPTIRYFIIDCRAREETRQGQIPTAFHFDPDAVTDPAVLETVLATLTPLKNTVHLCVMGHGYGHIADQLRQFLSAQNTAAASTSSSSSELPFFLKDDFLESFARDISRVNAAVLFLAKCGFPHVSVLDGGYAAAHTTLLNHHQDDAGSYSVADLIDHDAPQCTLCQHRRPTAPVSRSSTTTGSFTGTRTESRSSVTGDGSGGASASAANGGGSGGGESATRTSNPPSRGNSYASMPVQTGPKLSSSGSGELDARSLFDAHASPSSGSGSGAGANSYFSNFTGALKTGGKAMGMGMIPTPSLTLKDSSKWLMMGNKKPSSSPSSAGLSPGAASPGGPGDPPSPVAAKSPLGSAAMPNLSKIKSSLSHFGSESYDMLKKAEQAATKGAQLKGMFGSASSPNVKTTGVASPTMGGGGAGGGAPGGGGGGGATGSSRNGSFQRAEEDVFSIDDDDEEEQDDFVGGGRGSSRNSSSSSLSSTGHRGDSFSTSASTSHDNAGGGGGGGGVPSTVVLHTVEKGKVQELTKGMRVSRTQMLPFVESPFFSAYKKKKPVASPSSPSSPTPPAARASMLPRRLVVAENHVIVLKAERNMDDVYSVKSCHPLGHLSRMTCLKKNALMVTLYYKFKATTTGAVQEKKNAYEVQQRDEFIKVIKNAMEKM